MSQCCRLSPFLVLSPELSCTILPVQSYQRRSRLPLLAAVFSRSLTVLPQRVSVMTHQRLFTPLIQGDARTCVMIRNCLVCCSKSYAACISLMYTKTSCFSCSAVWPSFRRLPYPSATHPGYQRRGKATYCSHPSRRSFSSCAVITFPSVLTCLISSAKNCSNSCIVIFRELQGKRRLTTLAEWDAVFIIAVG
jgi:hypothetical protein